MRDLLPEFLEDVARDDAAAQAAEAAGGAGEALRGLLARALSLGQSGSRRGRDAPRAPRDDRLSARFLAEASAATAAIEAWRRDLADLRRTHAAAADAASTRALAETKGALYEKTRRASETSARLRETIDRLERGGETFSTATSTVTPSASTTSSTVPSDEASDEAFHTHERLVRTVAAGARAKFLDAARAFGAIQADARRRREETLRTRHFARHAGVPAEDAVRRAAEAEAEDVGSAAPGEGAAGGGSVGSAPTTPARPRPLRVETQTETRDGSARVPTARGATDGPQTDGLQTLRDARTTRLDDDRSMLSRSTLSRDDALASEKRKLETAVELERGAHQLRAAFVDMATLADSQGERVDSVEAHVAAAAVAATRGAETLRRAREYQKQRNRRLRRAGFVALVVALAAAAFVAAGFGAAF